MAKHTGKKILELEKKELKQLNRIEQELNYGTKELVTGIIIGIVIGFLIAALFL